MIYVHTNAVLSVRVDVGYGAGAGYFFRNVDGLAKQFKVYLVDLLGTGLSGISQLP